MYDYYIVPYEGIIIQIFTGNITTKDLKDMFLRIKNDPMFSDSHSFVTDFRDARIMLTVEELKDASEYMKRYSTSTGKTALLTSRSVDTAKLLIFCDQIKSNFRFSVFSTVQGASDFLQSDLKPYLKEDVSVREDVFL